MMLFVYMRFRLVALGMLLLSNINKPIHRLESFHFYTVSLIWLKCTNTYHRRRNWGSQGGHAHPNFTKGSANGICPPPLISTPVSLLWSLIWLESTQIISPNYMELDAAFSSWLSCAWRMDGKSHVNIHVWRYSERLYSAMADRAWVSDYFYTFHQGSKKRYTQRIAIFNSEDPYWPKTLFHSWRTIFPSSCKLHLDVHV